MSPWSHRSTLVVALAGLTDVVEVAYVDSPAGHGADELARLRRAYEADSTLDIDLATEFRDWSTTGIELYPPDLRDEIDALDRWLGPAVNQRVHRSIGIGGESARTRMLLDGALGTLDRRLANSRYLLGRSSDAGWPGTSSDRRRRGRGVGPVRPVRVR